jgi:hypothetical protein
MEVDNEDIRRGIPGVPKHRLSASWKPTVEEVEDEDFRSGRRYKHRPFAGEAGKTYGSKQETPFEQLREAQHQAGESIYHPFTDADEWEFVRFISKYLSQTQITEMLDLAFVSQNWLIGRDIDAYT